MEKRTFGQLIKENRGKIIKGTIIVVGVIAGVVAIKLLTNRGEKQFIDVVEHLDPENLTEGLSF